MKSISHREAKREILYCCTTGSSSLAEDLANLRQCTVSSCFERQRPMSDHVRAPSGNLAILSPGGDVPSDNARKLGVNTRIKP